MRGQKTRKTAKVASPRRPRQAKPKKSAIPPAKAELVALPTQPPLREPSPEELQELEVSLDHEEARVRVQGLAREYPRADLPLVNPLTAALKGVAGLTAVQARVVAQGLKRIGDKAHDMNEI